MSSPQPIALGVSAGGLLLLLGLIVFGDKGLVDLHYLREEYRSLRAGNRALVLENYALFQEKVRLEKADPGLIEHVARKELGFVGPEELVLIGPPSPPRQSSPDGRPAADGSTP